MDRAASDAVDQATEDLKAKLGRIDDAYPPDTPNVAAQRRAAIERAHDDYARAAAQARVEAIEGRRAFYEQQRMESGAPKAFDVEVSHLDRLLAEATTWRDGLAGGPSDPRRFSSGGESPLKRTLNDIREGNARAQAIGKEVVDVRDQLMTRPGPNDVAAAGALLLDGEAQARRIYVGNAGKGGGEPPAEEIHIRNADGSNVRGRQQRYGTPDDRFVGSVPNRASDAEAKLLADVRGQLTQLRDSGTEPAGTLVVGSSKLMCPSCQKLMHEIGGEFPGIQVVLATDTETVVFDSYAAEQHPAWVWGSQDVGQLKPVDLGMDAIRHAGPGANATPPSAAPEGKPYIPEADVRVLSASDFAVPDMSAALDPSADPAKFQALAQALRDRAVATGRIQAVIQDGHGNLRWAQGGSQAMLSPELDRFDLGDGGRILVRTTSGAIDVNDPGSIARLSAREIRDRTLILPPDGNPVQVEWSARMDMLRSGEFIRPHDSPVDTRLTGLNLDAVDRVGRPGDRGRSWRRRGRQDRQRPGDHAGPAGVRAVPDRHEDQPDRGQHDPERAHLRASGPTTALASTRRPRSRRPPAVPSGRRTPRSSSARPDSTSPTSSTRKPGFPSSSPGKTTCPRARGRITTRRGTSRRSPARSTRPSAALISGRR